MPSVCLAGTNKDQYNNRGGANHVIPAAGTMKGARKGCSGDIGCCAEVDRQGGGGNPRWKNTGIGTVIRLFSRFSGGKRTTLFPGLF